MNVHYEYVSQSQLKSKTIRTGRTEKSGLDHQSAVPVHLTTKESIGWSDIMYTPHELDPTTSYLFKWFWSWRFCSKWTVSAWQIQSSGAKSIIILPNQLIVVLIAKFSCARIAYSWYIINCMWSIDTSSDAKFVRSYQIQKFENGNRETIVSWFPFSNFYVWKFLTNLVTLEVSTNRVPLMIYRLAILAHRNSAISATISCFSPDYPVLLYSFASTKPVTAMTVLSLIIWKFLKCVCLYMLINNIKLFSKLL